jgi:hypothetical protein
LALLITVGPQLPCFGCLVRGQATLRPLDLEVQELVIRRLHSHI